MKRNVWLMPYSNFSSDYNPSWGLAIEIRNALRQKSASEKLYNCRIKRVGVNIYDADEAVDEVEFLDNSDQLKIDVVIAIGLGEPEGLFKFEHTGSASRNDISGQYDLYGRSVDAQLREYGIKIAGKVAGWYHHKDIHKLVRECEKKAGQKHESTGAGNYLCGYMTEKLAASPTLTDKGFFIHTQDYDPTKPDKERTKAGRLIANFIEKFCDIKGPYSEGIL